MAKIRQYARLSLTLALAVPSVVYLDAPAMAAQREPVILVHGWQGSSGVFAKMKAALENHGYPAYAIDLPGQENVANAEAIRGLVDHVRREHGGAKVSLVTHSMGGLSARHYLKFLGGAADTLSYVSMGTGHLGYWPACLVAPDQGGQMCPRSDFLKKLNDGDPTPGAVRYTLLTSSLDDSRDQDIAGRWCKAQFHNVRHANEPLDPVFINAVLDALAGRCPSPTRTFVSSSGTDGNQ